MIKIHRNLNEKMERHQILETALKVDPIFELDCEKFSFHHCERGNNSAFNETKFLILGRKLSKL